MTYKICIECTSLLQEIQIFINKTNLANGMFLKLENSLEVMDFITLNEIRTQHSLKPLKVIAIDENSSQNNVPSSSKFKEEEEEDDEYLETKIEMLSEGSAEYDDIQYADEESIIQEEEEESESAEFIETSESEESIKERIPTKKREKGSRPSTYKRKREKEDITEDEKLYQ